MKKTKKKKKKKKKKKTGSMALSSLARKFFLHSPKPALSTTGIIVSRRFITGNDTILHATQGNSIVLSKSVIRNEFSTGVNLDILKSSKWIIHRNFIKTHSKEIVLPRKIPMLVNDRGFARLAALPPHLQRQMGMKLYQGSPGIVIDPYRVRSRLPFFQRWFTREGWKQIREYLLHELKSAYAIAKLRQNAGYTKKKFYTEACALYKQINSAIAQGDRNTLKQLVTDNMFSIMKNELKQREAVWSRVLWEVVGPIKIQTLQGRMASTDAKSIDKAYIQLTLKIRSNQKFGAFAKNGDVLAGDPDKEIVVEDIWVFETKLGLPETKWHLCARITL